MPEFRFLRGLPIAVVTAVLAACAVGPDYVRPEVPVPGRFARDAPAIDGDVPAVVVATPDADAEFWAGFDDPILTRLVDAALLANHDLRIALARYDGANALLREAGFDRYPTVTATAGASDGRSSANQLPEATREERDAESYDAAIVAAWELDLFGRIRRNVEAQRADTRASASDLAALQVIIAGEVARSYVELRGLQERLRVARENADNQRETLRLARSSIPRVPARSSNRRWRAFLRSRRPLRSRSTGSPC
jgi:outer membrane protein TolC